MYRLGFDLRISKRDTCNKCIGKSRDICLEGVESHPFSSVLVGQNLNTVQALRGRPPCSENEYEDKDHGNFGSCL
jgi:hypothetical protein